mmetsp:Transcript_96649/g.242443  ORF Transcript_96649/g.242443 Transcript_96649/m.242443 type:complete len:347 (-) Transcript_96649:773-1813(-)
MEASRPADSCAAQWCRPQLRGWHARRGGIKCLHKRSQRCNQAVCRHCNLVLANASQSPVATSSMAHLIPTALSRPRCHPWLHMRWPALHAALLLQKKALTVHLLKATPNHDKDPHADCCDACSTEELPREHRRRCLARFLHRSCQALPALSCLHLLLEACLTRPQVLGSGDHVESILEGRRQGPFHRPPRLPRHLCHLLVLNLRCCKVIQAKGPSKLDQVANPRQEIDEGLPANGRLQNAVIDGHAQHCNHWHKGHDPLHRQSAGIRARLVDNVELQNTEMRGHKACCDGPGRPQAAQLTEDVAHRVETGGGEPMRHEVKNPDAPVDIVAPPLLLQAPIKLEVLRV